MKKSLSVLMSTTMAVTMFSTAALGASASKSSADFGDLANLDAGTKVKYDAMIAAGIFDGVSDGVFGLHDKMNRAQFAKVAALIFGLKVDNALRTSSFSDVSADDPANGYALPYIEALKAAHLTDGYGAGTYNPAGEVTKEQLAAFLIRGLNKEAQASAAAGSKDNTVSDWAQGYAALAVQLNLLGKQADGTFGGVAPATRDLLVTSSYEAQKQYVPGSHPAVSVLPADDMKAYAITSDTQAQIKGILQEKTLDGWRIGAVIKLNNGTSNTIRIPDYELRVKAADGTVYTLQPSANNAKSILPQSDATMNYMADVSLKSDLNLTDLLWINVDTKVYPKKETLLADAPVQSMIWRGKDAVISDPALLGDWGAVFSAPGETSGLKYSATTLSKQFAGQSPTYVVQVKVENTGSYTETVPDFTLGGKSDGQLFVGKRVEQEAISLNAGEQKNIHFAVTTDPTATLNAFYVLSAQSFLKQGQTAPVQFNTGRIGFRLPANASSGTGAGNTASSYAFGTPMAFDSSNDFINPNLAVSLEELHVTNNEETGNKVGLAKFKLFNNGDKPIPVPVFAAELAGKDGYTYSGNRQTVSAQDIAPGTGIVVSYGYTLPSTDTNEQYALNIQGVLPGQGQQAGYKSTIASYQVNVQSNTMDHSNISLYPFNLNIKSWTLSQLSNMGATGFSYTYKLNLDLDLTRDEAVTLDNSFSKLKLELVDALGKSIGSTFFPFIGANRLMSGTQKLTFGNLTDDQIRSNVYVKVYETISTPTGDVDRLITELK
ncbi:S-layer homology domain-containing protein [Bacillus sp. 3255]|uniref:S-layer homology domain-containing protein n=1 Tax=Bacillus sp. 3255 TaxID=2817904 RepID=UPI002865E056|nr:S-layer homology domain-containing protein [Bacillus sp. 3255]MDR6878495.1 hypothetical protein [Bacillus sp. 3255]